MPESRMEALFGEQHHWELERMIPAHPRGEGAHDSRPTFLYVPNLNVYLSKIILTPIERSQVHVLTPTSTGSFSFGFCLGGFPGVVGGTFFEALLGVLLIVFVGPFAFQLFMVSIVLVAVFQQWTATGLGFESAWLYSNWPIRARVDDVYSNHTLKSLRIVYRICPVVNRVQR